jgi:hypothetical protein
MRTIDAAHFPAGQLMKPSWHTPIRQHEYSVLMRSAIRTIKQQLKVMTDRPVVSARLN